MRVRVIAPCRLHFGLMHVPVTDSPKHRRFGGVGLMLEEPAVTVTATPHAEFATGGYHEERAMGLVVRLLQRFARDHHVLDPVRLTADGPPEHVGFGVGTALSLAVARAVAGPRPVEELAALTGRGERSGIGVHGFARGGFLVDAGKVGDERLSALHTRLEFPPDWHVVLIRPTAAHTWHGVAERAAFARPRDADAAAATAERLWTIAVDELIPAVRRAAFTAFADAIYRYNRLAGEPFATDQGGAYSGPGITHLVETLRGWGVAGAGQSSWGPTVFAFAEDGHRARQLADRCRAAFPLLADLTVSRANNTGAEVSTE